MTATNKIACLIVDDEPMALSLMEDYVAKIPFLELKGKCSNAFQALEKIHEEKIDVVFLDIQMPELNGVELSRTLSKNTRVVFTTAFDNYALEGFKVDALDYLLKPYNFEEFYNAAVKAKEWFDLVANASQASFSKEEIDYIFIRSDYKQLKIKLNDILYIEGLKDYVKIWLVKEDRPILTHSSLKKLEEELPVNKFMRVHRSFIIALDKIEAIERSQAIINKQYIPVADQFKQKFQDFVGRNSLD
ncbi:LytR/AlgR family response regulator transcription factor [Cytophaga aurantiaca]|uniref:LytR/AlgR family response regulator transcription factor n=1 Tax=Cytophaga aurantiaca TaxID=29530 RepID=UPI000381CF36|nr:LytTR family DNA-binding domain-containing protein [Cytophaga aurantiaca]